MTTDPMHRAVSSLANRTAAENALTVLRDSGFNMGKVSIAVKGEETAPDKIAGVEVTGTLGNHGKEGAATGATTGAVLGGVSGLLVGLGALAIPGIGPVMLAGAIGTATVRLLLLVQPLELLLAALLAPLLVYVFPKAKHNATAK